jgi:hypothetical protein
LKVDIKRLKSVTATPLFIPGSCAIQSRILSRRFEIPAFRSHLPMGWSAPLKLKPRGASLRHFETIQFHGYSAKWVEFLAKLIEFFTTGLSSQQELKFSDFSDNRVLIDISGRLIDEKKSA